MPLLASISEVPVQTSATVGDDPFSRFISLRNLAASTARNVVASKNCASLSGQFYLPLLRYCIHGLILRLDLMLC